MKISGVDIFNVRKTIKLAAILVPLLSELILIRALADWVNFLWVIQWGIGGNWDDKELSERFLLGADPLNIEKIWQIYLKRVIGLKAVAPLFLGA